MDLRGKRVLITGAAGFIGGRLAERLAQEEGARVRGLVRARTVEARHSPDQDSTTTRLGLDHSDSPDAQDLANASPLRDAGIAIGDVVDADAVRRAVDGCDLVVHCAAMQGGRSRINEYRRTNVDGTLNVLRAARDVNVARFVHISTINVHGVPPPSAANAESPLVFSGDFYSVSKAEGERAAWHFAREYNLPLVVIRPACTYGPRSNAWTLTPLRRVQRGRPVLIGRGEGICNAVYIDNLVDLILLTMRNDAAVGQAFIGAERRGVTWREFYSAYARMLGVTRLRSMPRGIALMIATAFEMLARLDGRAPRIARASVEFYSHRVVFDIEKARRVLGYAPRVSFEEGMRKTEEWLRAAGYLANDK